MTPLFAWKQASANGVLLLCAAIYSATALVSWLEHMKLLAARILPNLCWMYEHGLAECMDIAQQLNGGRSVLSLALATSATLALSLSMLHKNKKIGWSYAQPIVAVVEWLVRLVQWFVVVYQSVRIAMSLAACISVKTTKRSLSLGKQIYIRVLGEADEHAEELKQRMKTAQSYAEWMDIAKYLDTLEHKQDWKAMVRKEDLEHCDFRQLERNMSSLKQAIERKNVAELKYIVAASASRNKLGIDSPMLHLECRSGATKDVITQYNALVIQALELLRDADPKEFPEEEKALLFKRMKQSFGSSALCLGGGGAVTMYHLGAIKALLEADLLPNVISGSSGGAIAAAMLACKTKDELLNEIIHNKISTQYIPDLGISWFPSLIDQLKHCVKTGFLVECSIFERTTKHYYGEPMDAQHKVMYYTFQDAFLKTGRHVCIPVTASCVSGHKGPKKLLLSHVTAPHVLLWSAVAVSCSLPTFMKQKQLMARDHEGNVVPYVSSGKEWVDGTIQNDLPMELMAKCFNVTNFIVSQMNPIHGPFVSDEVNSPKFKHSRFHTLENMLAADVRHRLHLLEFLGVFPNVYGQHFNFVTQNYTGHVTILPDFVFLEIIALKMILNPTVEDMDRYIAGGQRAVWPKLAYIRHLCEIEKCLDQSLAKLL